MQNKIISLSIIISMVVSQGICFAYDYEFDPVLQDNQGYRTQYPMPSQNSNYNQNQIPVNNTYQPQSNEYNNYNGNNFNNYSNYNYDNQLRGNVVMVPAKTTFPAVLMTPLSSETSRTGDSVSMFLGSDFYYGKNLIAPAGSRVQGSVIKAKKGTYGKINGQLQVKFTNIVTPSGQIIPITASIVTDDGSGILKAGTKLDAAKDYTKSAVIGAGAGAVLGVVMGALSKGSVGKGAIYGTAVGGGLGLAQGAIQKGGNVELPQNAQFDIVLDQPVTVSSNSLY